MHSRMVARLPKIWTYNLNDVFNIGYLTMLNSDFLGEISSILTELFWFFSVG